MKKTAGIGIVIAIVIACLVIFMNFSSDKMMNDEQVSVEEQIPVEEPKGRNLTVEFNESIGLAPP